MKFGEFEDIGEAHLAEELFDVEAVVDEMRFALKCQTFSKASKYPKIIRESLELSYNFASEPSGLNKKENKLEPYYKILGKHGDKSSLNPEKSAQAKRH